MGQVLQALPVDPGHVRARSWDLRSSWGPGSDAGRDGASPPTTPTTLGAATLTSLFPPWLVFLAFYTTLNVFGFRFFNMMTALNFELWDDGTASESATLWTMIAIVVGLVCSLKWSAGRSGIGDPARCGPVASRAGDPRGRLLDLGGDGDSCNRRLICSVSSCSRWRSCSCWRSVTSSWSWLHRWMGCPSSDFAVAAKSQRADRSSGP